MEVKEIKKKLKKKLQIKQNKISFREGVHSLC